MATESLRPLATDLQLKREVHAGFEAIVRWYLRFTYDAYSPPRAGALMSNAQKNDLINRATLAFMEANVAWFWPTYIKGHEDKRSHLTVLSAHGDISELRWREYLYKEKVQDYEKKLSVFKANGGKGKAPSKPMEPKMRLGFIHDRDGRMRGEDSRPWKQRHRREPNEDDEVLGSKIGRRVRVYFAKMVALGYFR